MSLDLLLSETLSGGDIVQKGNDLSVIYGFQNMAYLGMFGGNPGFVTPTNRLKNQAFDYWGNSLLMPNKGAIQFNSLTEYTLNNTPLTSNGRAIIEQAVGDDLRFMTSFALVSISVVISGIDRVNIGVRIQQPDNLENKDYIFIWDATNKELSSTETPMSNPVFQEAFLLLESGGYRLLESGGYRLLE